MKQPELIDSGEGFERAGLIHRVLQPDTAGPHRTAVLLHGRSGNEDVMWIFQRTLPKDWLLVAPRAIEHDPAGGFAWHPRKRDEWPTLAMFDEAVSAVVRFIQSLPDLYRADPTQIYLMGFSQGAAMAIATAIREPDLVQGIAGLVGFVPEDCKAAVGAGVLGGLPVFMAVGTEDSTIPLERSRESADVLRRAGANLAYHEFDTGHKLNAKGMRALREWFNER